MCYHNAAVFLVACLAFLASSYSDSKVSRKGFILAAGAVPEAHKEQRISNTCSRVDIGRSGICIDTLTDQTTLIANEGVTSCLQRDCTEGDRRAASSLNEDVKGIENADNMFHQRLQSESKVLQLVRPSDSHDTLMVEMEALEALERIDEPVAFVSVAGPYHGGKSFLLNVLLNSTLGFTVGTRPDPETHGIWIRILPPGAIKSSDGSRVVLMDTEGLFGDGTTRLYDAKVFAIATLLSSHLIYNTLRTLGDKQSVSTLADLAKHAQIFNLQNWLHSSKDLLVDDHGTAPCSSEVGTPSTTCSSSSMLPDPLLLLHSLSFPNLTWVVQGFDIDLPDPEASPTRFLQRYLEALSMSGDRTLDSLFGREVRCIAVRTPTDLNAIREEMGGEGLGNPDVDLFRRLHPEFVADVARIRAHVERGLTAKGKGFTGKVLARLIPLLVHYANSDFPLNAEQPLQRTMQSLLLGSAQRAAERFFDLQVGRAMAGSIEPGRGVGMTRESREGGAPSGAKQCGMALFARAGGVNSVSLVLSAQAPGDGAARESAGLLAGAGGGGTGGEERGFSADEPLCPTALGVASVVRQINSFASPISASLHLVKVPPSGETSTPSSQPTITSSASPLSSSSPPSLSTSSSPQMSSTAADAANLPPNHLGPSLSQTDTIADPHDDDDEQQPMILVPWGALHVLAHGLREAELEDVINKGQLAAISYCRQRSVGLPADAITADCGRHVAVYRARRGPQFVDQSREAVRGALESLTYQLESEARKHLRSIRLPIEDSQLEEAYRIVSTAVLAVFDWSTARHNLNPAVPKSRSALDNTVQLVFAAVQSHNSRLVHTLLTSAWKECTLAYEASMQATISANPYRPLIDDGGDGSDSLAYLRASCAMGVPAGVTMTTSHTCEACRVRDSGELPCVGGYFAAGHDGALRAGQEKFVAVVAAGGMPWLEPGQLSYETMLASCAKRAEGVMREQQGENERRVWAFSQAVSTDLLVVHRAQLGAIQPMPDNDEVIVEKARSLQSLALSCYLNITIDLTSHQGVKEGHNSLLSGLQRLESILVGKNTDMMTNLCYGPLREAKESLKMEECLPSYYNAFIARSWWSAKCLWPFPSFLLGFRPEATAAAEHSLAKAQVRFHTDGDTALMGEEAYSTLSSHEPGVSASKGSNSARATYTSSNAQGNTGRRAKQPGKQGPDQHGDRGAGEGAVSEAGTRPSGEVISTGEAGSRDEDAPDAAAGDGLVGTQAGRQVAGLSEATRKRVIAAWMERDMGRYTAVVYINFTLLSLALAALIAVVLWILRCLRLLARWLLGLRSPVRGTHRRDPHGIIDSKGGGAGGGCSSGGGSLQDGRINGRDANKQVTSTGGGAVAGSTSQSLFLGLFGKSSCTVNSAPTGSPAPAHVGNRADTMEGAGATTTNARLAAVVKTLAESARNSRNNGAGGSDGTNQGSSESKPVLRRRSSLLTAVLQHARRLSMDGSSGLGEVTPEGGSTEGARSNTNELGNNNSFITPPHSGPRQGANMDKSAARKLFESFSERVGEKEQAQHSAPPKLSGAYYRAADGQWRRFKSPAKS